MVQKELLDVVQAILEQADSLPAMSQSLYRTYASTFPRAPALPLTIRGFSHLHKSVDL